MQNILLIESTSPICSVAVCNGNSLTAIKETTDNSHSIVLTQFIVDVLKEAGITTADLSAVAVSKGPGSYTGLRIGVSAAKGLCYSLDIPLIAIDTLYALALTARKKYDNMLLCPMIDARRMEVYTSTYSPEMEIISDIEAKIIDNESYQEILQDNKMMFFGSGAPKTKDVITHANAFFDDEIRLSAANLMLPAQQLFEDKKFEDIAYFEPMYLKEFVAKKSVVKALSS